MTQPNFFIIGAAKAGTSSLGMYLSRHPEIFMSSFKEPAYFLGPPTKSGVQRLSRRYRGPIASDKYRASLSEYLSLFSEASGKKIIGEASVGYAQAPHYDDVAARIFEFSPEARFVYLLRDPVERTISHYWYNVANEDEVRDIHTAVSQDPYYTDVSDYARQLREYLQFFPTEQFHIITTESLAADPARTLKELFAWLGVDENFLPDNIERRFNPTPKTVKQLKTNGFLHRLRYSRSWDRLGYLVPKPIRRAAIRLVEKEVDRTSVDIDRAVEYLRPIQLRQTEELSGLLGREFPEWNSLFGDRASVAQDEPTAVLSR